MTRVYGNGEVWAQFDRDRPRAALLDGPRGVGKFTGATLAAERIAGIEAIMRVQNATVRDMREVIRWFEFRADTPKVAIIEPGNCHANVWALLKTLLESLPDRAHVWIVGSYEYPVPSGVRDRCFTYQLTLLQPKEMEAFLEQAETVLLDSDYIVTLGSADRVIEMNRALTMKPAVANWIKGVEESNRELFLTATKTWEQRHTDLLIAELESQLEGKTLVEGVRFERVHRDKVLRALVLLHDGVNPHLTAVATGYALMPR